MPMVTVLSFARAPAAQSEAPNTAPSIEYLHIIEGPPVRPSHWPICGCLFRNCGDVSPYCAEAKGKLCSGVSQFFECRFRPRNRRSSIGQAHRLDRLALPEHCFDVVAVGIENECRVIARRIGSGAKSRPAVVLTAGR